jgi:hypothetical protein
MYKGLSDVSQYGALLASLDNITEFVESFTVPRFNNYDAIIQSLSDVDKFAFLQRYFPNERVNKESFNTILEIWRTFQIPRIIGVSSDLIAAALMTNISSLYGDSFLPVLSTRKTGGQTAFIISQNYKVVAMCEFLLSCLQEHVEIPGSNIIKRLFREFCHNGDGVSYLFDHDRIQSDFDDLFRLREDMLDFGDNFTDAMFTILTTDLTKVTDIKMRSKIGNLRDRDNIYNKFIKLTVFIKKLETFFRQNKRQFEEYAIISSKILDDGYINDSKEASNDTNTYEGNVPRQKLHDLYLKKGDVDKSIPEDYIIRYINET